MICHVFYLTEKIYLLHGMDKVLFGKELVAHDSVATSNCSNI